MVWVFTMLTAPAAAFAESPRSSAAIASLMSTSAATSASVIQSA
jgi:hypothetical protein